MRAIMNTNVPALEVQDIHKRFGALEVLKGSALASVITILDITGVARVIVARTFAPYELFLMAGVLYLLMTFVITRAVNAAEYRLSCHLRPPAEADAAASP